MQQLTRAKCTPGRIRVHRLRSDHHRSGLREVGGVDADRAPGARVLQLAISAGAAGGALEHVQLVRVGVAERPHLPRRYPLPR